jgi:hypothetical protein
LFPRSGKARNVSTSLAPSGETAVIVLSLKGEAITIGDRVELTARCRLVKK